jgi:predicted amidohydrolase
MLENDSTERKMRRFSFFESTLFFLLLLCTFLATAEKREQDLADGWQAGAPREEIRPHFFYEAGGGPDGAPALVITSDQRQGLNGFWRKTFAVTGGSFYRFYVLLKTENVPAPRRSAVVEIVWQDDHGRTVSTDMGSVQPELPAQRGTRQDGWTEVSDVYRIPERATHAQIDLRLRWAHDAAVRWSKVSFAATTPPPKRLVRLAAAHFAPEGGKSPADNIRMMEPLIKEAAAQKVDMIVFSEVVTTHGVHVASGPRTESNWPISFAETVPGPITSRLGDMARKYGLYIVAGTPEREGHLLYNTAVLMGPDGNLVGKYHKMVLTAGEARDGVTPGDDYPVFVTRFGKVGMMICYDLFFPEVARQLAIRGADIIAVPIWGGDPLLAQTRAIDNRVFLVTSTYAEPWMHWMRSGIWDREGSLIAAAKSWGTIAAVEVDLNERFDHKWLGDFRNHVPRERPLGGEIRLVK